MKKIFVVILCIILIFSFSGCFAKKIKIPNITPPDLNDLSDFFDEDPTEETGGNRTPDETTDNKGSYTTFQDARLDFDNYITEISPEKEETVMLYAVIVSLPELEVFEYITPLLYWGETLDDDEIEVQDIIIDLLTGEKKGYRSVDVQRTGDNKYTSTLETHDDEEIVIDVKYHPDIDGLRLEATKNGEFALLFEYVKNGDGYAAQYYFNAKVGGSYGAEPVREPCLFKYIFVGREGSIARFNNVEEPDSILDGVPDEQEFINGATHWLTLKDDEFTGELDGIAF